MQLFDHPFGILAVVDLATFAISLSLIIGFVLLAGFAFIVGFISYTALRAWLFTVKQKRSLAAYEEDLIKEKAEWKKMQNEPFLRNANRRSE